MTVPTLENIKESLFRVFEGYRDKIVFAYLFGSAAKNEMSPLSDIDIAVYLSGVESEAFFDIKLSLHADICRTLKRNDVDLLILNTVPNNILIADIIRHGVVIYETNREAREDYEVRKLHDAIDFKTHRFSVLGV